MVSSIFGIIFSGYRETSTSLKYNDIKFTRINNQWSATIDNNKMLFDYYPEEIEHINVSPELKGVLQNTLQIDVTSDADSDFKDTIALTEFKLSESLSDFNTYLRMGFTTENEFGLPIITCLDATISVPVLYFKSSNQTSLTLDNNCIIAGARNDLDFIKLKDRILYSTLNVIG